MRLAIYWGRKDGSRRADVYLASSEQPMAAGEDSLAAVTGYLAAMGLLSVPAQAADGVGRRLLNCDSVHERTARAAYTGHDRAEAGYMWLDGADGVVAYSKPYCKTLIVCKRQVLVARLGCRE